MRFFNNWRIAFLRFVLWIDVLAEAFGPRRRYLQIFSYLRVVSDSSAAIPLVQLYICYFLCQ